MKVLSKYISILIFICCVSIHCVSAQRKDSVLITPDTQLGDIGWFYQFTFIHEKPINKVDLWVKKLKPFGHYDSTIMRKYMDELGAIRSKESYALLYLMCGQLMMIKHSTAYNDFVSYATHYGAFEALNKYYLNQVVNTKLPRLKFAEEVLKLCSKNRPTCYYYK